MNWIEPLSEDFLYCDPQEIKTELYRVCSDEQLLPAEQPQTERAGEQADDRKGDYHD